MIGAQKDEEIERLCRRLEELDRERTRLQARIAELQTLAPCPVDRSEPAVTTSSPAVDKVALFRLRFAGRTDVFPVRWENVKSGRSGYAPACANEWVRGVCGKPQVKCGECPSQAFIHVSNDVIECHLRGEDRIRANGRGGDFVVGVYPLLFDDTCKFLAVDFDGENWSTDAFAFLATCRELDIPAALERS